jgi:DinB superfamily
MTTTASTLRGYLKLGHDWFEGTMQGVTPELAHWSPQGKAHPIGANYIHVITSEDFLMNGIVRGGAPLMASSFAGKTGFSEPPPPGNRDDWARNMKIDVDSARIYAQAVYAATDAYLASASDEDLDRIVDLSAVGFGTQPVSFVIGLLLLNVHNHCGEISCLKGLNGLQGYPG